MQKPKKRFTDVRRLYAALAQTDPGSTDLIFLRPAGYLPAVRLLSLQLPSMLAPRRARHARATPTGRPDMPARGSHARPPAWQRRLHAPKKSPVSLA